MMTRTEADWKRAAVEQWTLDPCGANEVDLQPGTRAYFERLVTARKAYAPWLDDVLGYDATAGLDALDVGCGQGIDLYRYAAAGARATGVDLTPRHVELARAHAAAMGVAAEVVEGDAEKLPFPDESFDRVSSNGVLHHTPDIEQALREIHRVLRRGGEARVIVYNRSSLHYWLKQVATEGVLRGGLVRERSMAGVLSSGVEYSSVGARPLVRVYTPRRLRRLLTEAGFTDCTTSVRHFHAADTPMTGLIARRFRGLEDPRVLAWIGRHAGWYAVGRGRKEIVSRGAW